MSLLTPTPANSMSLSALKERTKNLPPENPLSFFSAGGLDLMQRAAFLLAGSTLAPDSYRSVIYDKRSGQMIKNESALSNCVLALNMAQRIGADPLMIMQNLYIVDGRPGWSSQFVIASINASGKFSPLRFKMEDLGEKEMEWKTAKWVDGPNGKRMRKDEIHKAKIKNRACTAWAIEKSTGDKIEGPTVSMETAVAEGWYGKDGSKWQTMPEVMLRYRAASFFGKLYAPELLMGLQTADEVRDATIIMEPGDDGGYVMSMDDLNQRGEADSDAETEPAEPVEISSHSEPETDKRAADRQRAAKAASRAKSKENAQAGLQTMAPPPESEPHETDGIQCPKETPGGNAMFVTEADCMKCASRAGCPAWPEEW